MYQSYRDGGVDHLVVGNFGEINKGFKKFIAETAILAGGQSDAANMTQANWTDVGGKDALRLMKKRFKVTLGCVAVRLQSDLLIRWIQFIQSTRNAAYAAACASPPQKDTSMSMEIHGLTTKKMMMLTICSDRITMNTSGTTKEMMVLNFNVVTYVQQGASH